MSENVGAYELLQLVSCTIGAEQEDYAPWQPNVSH
jgi:hypothetical protein